MDQDLHDLYQEVILDHSKSPRNFSILPGANRTAEGQNPLCGDQVMIYLKLNNDRIEEITFQGSGCAISKASASILTLAVKGKTKEEVKALFQKVHAMVTTGQQDFEQTKLAVFAGVHKFPARVKCAILPWHAAMAALDGQDSVSTE